MKKFISIVLVLIMISMLLLSGCKKDVSKTNNNEGSDKKNEITSNTSSEKETKPDKIIFPLEEQITLTAFVHTRPTVDDFENNAFTKILEEETNINLEFIVVGANEAQDRLNLLFSTGDYPDLILAPQLSPEQQALYGSQGVLLPLNDLIEKYGENTKKLFELYPEAKQKSTMLDGNIYNLPQINVIPNVANIRKLYIYKPWLDKLKLDMPETTEEFYKVMKAFATQDPNGNGKPDEIPLAGAYKGWGSQIEYYFLGSFVNASNGRLFVEDGKVKASYVTEEWKEGIKYLQRLCSEGLLAKESFTQTYEGLKQMGENPGEVILGAFTAGYHGVATNLAGDRWKDYVSLPPLEGPNGVRTTEYNPYNYFYPGFSITDKCEYPEIAMALGDLLYDETLSLCNFQGPEGIGWEYIDDDTKYGFLEGEKALYQKLAALEEQGPNTYWKLANFYIPEEVFRGGYTENPYDVDKITYEATKQNEPYYPDPDTILPSLKFTEEQSAELMTYSVTINDFVDQKIAEFVTTDIDIDAAWDDYINTLKDIGLERFLEIHQEAYDALK